MNFDPKKRGHFFTTFLNRKNLKKILSIFTPFTFQVFTPTNKEKNHKENVEKWSKGIKIALEKNGWHMQFGSIRSV